MKYAVSVHCGSAHVSGRAKEFRYYVASLFRRHLCKEGYYVMVNTGITAGRPRRSKRLAVADGRALARVKHARFVNGYGSLHNMRVGDV